MNIYVCDDGLSLETREVKISAVILYISLENKSRNKKCILYELGQKTRGKRNLFSVLLLPIRKAAAF